MLVLSRAMDTAVAKAREHGVGIVGTHHTATSTGALGYYAEKVTQLDTVAVVDALAAGWPAKEAVRFAWRVAVAAPSISADLSFPKGALRAARACSTTSTQRRRRARRGSC